MSPAPFTPEKQCYTVLFLRIFGEVVLRRLKGSLGGITGGGGVVEVIEYHVLEDGLEKRKRGKGFSLCVEGAELKRLTTNLAIRFM
jgi:hypothetical protein